MFPCLLSDCFNMACWAHSALTEFIELYRSEECLWKIKSPSYSNRNLKEQAYQRLLQFVHTFEPTATKDTITKKKKAQFEVPSGGKKRKLPHLTFQVLGLIRFTYQSFGTTTNWSFYRIKKKQGLYALLWEGIAQ